MNSKTTKLLRTWSWAIIPGLVAFVFGYMCTMSSEAQRTGPPDSRADPKSFLPGTLSPAAAASARGFSEFPLVWLGEEFAGFRLTEFIRTNYYIPKGQTRSDRDQSENSVTLIYGTCIPDRSGEVPSCVPPLSIIIWAPTTVPGPQSVAPEAAGPLTSARGLTSRLVSGSTMLWTDNGLAITVHSNADVRNATLNALRTANAARGGLRDIGPGENLAPLRDFRPSR